MDTELAILIGNTFCVCHQKHGTPSSKVALNRVKHPDIEFERGKNMVSIEPVYWRFP